MNNNITYVHTTLEQMLTQEVRDILNQYKFGYTSYYWKNGDGELHEIVELDLLRGRFITDDGDYSKFDWELKESRIYKVDHRL